MLTTIDQFAGKDIWVYAELEYEDAYIRVEKVLDDGTVWYNAWLPSDSLDKYDRDEILYGELISDIDDIEIHPLDTLTTEEIIAKIEADGEISGCSEVTSSKKFTKYPQGYVKATSDNSEYVLTAEGRRKVERYVKELAAKRKEILDADKDTIEETPDPVTVDDIVSDLNWGGVDENGEYLNGWYVTDNYDSDYPICLQLGVDFIEK